MPSTIGIVAGHVFTPGELSPVLWFDAADTSTITASSNQVSQWNDKSINGYHITQGTSGNQPKTGTRTLNGRNVIDFDGTDDYLVRSSSSVLGKNISGATVYVVARHDSFPTTQRLILFIATAVSAVSTRLSSSSGITSGKALFGGRTLDADGFARVDSSTSVSTTVAEVYTGVYDYANTDLFIYINNALEGTNSSFQTATTTSNTDSSALSIGATSNGGIPFDGIVAEVLMFHSAHDAATRTVVYNYLKSKWGL